MGHNRSFTAAEQHAWQNFLLANRRVLARLDADLVQESGMTLAEYEVLAHLADADDHRLRMNELAELARLSPSGLTRRFDALVRRGWVARERCDDDRRGVLARLTDQGLAELESARPVHDRGERQYFFDLLEPDHVASLGEMMRRLAVPDVDGSAARATA
jgi:DNA-binding MarR family transcriptional regulator